MALISDSARIRMASALSLSKDSQREGMGEGID